MYLRLQTVIERFLRHLGQLQAQLGIIRLDVEQPGVQCLSRGEALQPARAAWPPQQHAVIAWRVLQVRRIDDRQRALQLLALHHGLAMFTVGAAPAHEQAASGHWQRAILAIGMVQNGLQPQVFVVADLLEQPLDFAFCAQAFDAGGVEVAFGA